jgi:hypothetical protein
MTANRERIILEQIIVPRLKCNSERVKVSHKSFSGGKSEFSTEPEAVLSWFERAQLQLRHGGRPEIARFCARG